MTELEEFFVGVEREFGIQRWDNDDYGYYGKHDLDQITSVPEGFKGSSWHNDVCASMATDWVALEGGYNIDCYIWIEGNNLALRELDWGTQFELLVECDATCYSFKSDNWNEIVEHAPKARELMRLIVETNSIDGFDKYADKAREYGFEYVR